MTVLIGRVLLEKNSDIEIHWEASLEQAVTQLIQNTDLDRKLPYDLVIVVWTLIFFIKLGQFV